MKPHATTAAIDARRRQAAQKLEQVEKAIGQLRRERGRLTVRAVAERAGVSVTFLYENSKARALVSNAVDASRTRQLRAAQVEHEQIEASWRERALNAEAELGRTQKEVFAQRQQIGELMGSLAAGVWARTPGPTSPAQRRRDTDVRNSRPRPPALRRPVDVASSARVGGCWRGGSPRADNARRLPTSAGTGRRRSPAPACRLRSGGGDLRNRRPG
ncbi:DUF6262 family protein [Streptomyces sp. NBC_01136]|uniref:DUF6262 family protein n=1 Tax=Streptomyces sp. NBC_01136 TaxID=2903754 RepID=UPI003867640E